MNSIGVAVFLVRCASNLLVCETMTAEHMRYADMDTCKEEVARLVKMKSTADGSRVWMGKCLYQMAEADPRRERRDRAFSNSHIIRTADASR